ncbi:MAG: energy transducer TonB [Prevotella sp.]|nr:energy transducer TonB [Prevotella sp.]
MAQVDLLEKNWVDMVFEGRNTAYGAYQMRKDTGKRNGKALISMLVFVGCIVGGSIALTAYQHWQASRVSIETDVELSQLAEKKEAKVEKKEPVIVEPEKVVEQVKSSVKFVAPVIKKDDEVRPEDEMKSQDELAETKTAIGTFNVEGNDDANGEVLKAKEVIAQPEPPKEEETKVFDVVEEMPSFPGGQAELMSYLSKNIKYPVVAEENGVQGRVILTFVVERNGSITDIKVVKSVDPSLDKEAIRVVKGMPNWIPGKQNGSSVRVKFTLPVIFRLQ